MSNISKPFPRLFSLIFEGPIAREQEIVRNPSMNVSHSQARIRLFLGLRFGSTLVSPTTTAKQPSRRSSRATEADVLR